MIDGRLEWQPNLSEDGTNSAKLFMTFFISFVTVQTKRQNNKKVSSKKQRRLLLLMKKKIVKAREKKKVISQLYIRLINGRGWTEKIQIILVYHH